MTDWVDMKCSRCRGRGRNGDDSECDRCCGTGKMLVDRRYAESKLLEKQIEDAGL